MVDEISKEDHAIADRVYQFTTILGEVLLLEDHTKRYRCPECLSKHGPFMSGLAVENIRIIPELKDIWLKLKECGEDIYMTVMKDKLTQEWGESMSDKLRIIRYSMNDMVKKIIPSDHFDIFERVKKHFNSKNDDRYSQDTMLFEIDDQ